MNLSYIRSLLLLPIPFLILTGCEQKFDSVIDSFQSDFQVLAVSPSTEVFYSPNDSLVTISIQFNSTSTTIQNVFCDVYSSENLKLASLILYNDGRQSIKRFVNEFPISRSDPNGIYNIKYFVTDIFNDTKEVAMTSFIYHNGQNNVAPVISNLILVDSTAKDVPFTFSIDVTDSNGLSDIKKVFYELYRPNGTKVFNSQGISEFPLFDDGNTTSDGDLTANDGRYTVRLTFPNSPSVPSGDWRFEFTAEDRAGATSNKIVKTVKVL